MSKTAELIHKLRANSEPVLIGYFPAGYPNLEKSIQACLTMLDAGVDILELGVPYSDPVMDGLVIQEATESALSNGFKLRQIFDVVRGIKEKSNKPVLVMSYWNPVMQYGVDRFARDLQMSGAEGLITPDLIPDEATAWLAISDELDLDRVFMATPSSSQLRLDKAAELSRGFVYAVSTMGITGAREDLDAKARAVVSGVRAAGGETPVCVGIGISSGEQVAEVNSYSDGAIVGSALIKAFNEGGLELLRETVIKLKAGAQN